MSPSTIRRLRGLFATTLLAAAPTTLACESTPRETPAPTRTIETETVEDEIQIVVVGDESGNTWTPAQPSASRTFAFMIGPDGRPVPMDSAAVAQAGDESAPPMLGIMMAAAEKGVRIVEVMDGSPAAAAGMRAGDVIVSSDGELLTTDRLTEKLAAFERGQTVMVKAIRGDAIKPFQVTLGGWATPMATGVGAGFGPGFDMGGSTIVVEGVPLENGAVPGRMVRRFVGGDGDGIEMEFLVEMIEEEMFEHDEHHRHDGHEGHHGHDEHEGHHDREHADIGEIVEVLREHFPELFHDAEVSIDVEAEGDRELEIHIEIERWDHEDEDDHDRHDHHEHRDHDDDHRHHDDDHGHHDDDDHGSWIHAAFEEMHIHVEEMLEGAMMEMHEWHERLPMLEHEMNERFEMFAHEWQREVEGFAREWQSEVEGFAGRIEETMNDRAREGEAFARRVGEALRRSEERNRMLEQRIGRLEAMLKRLDARPDDRRAGREETDRRSGERGRRSSERGRRKADRTSGDRD